MSDQETKPNTLQVLATEVGHLLAPLADAASTAPEGFFRLAESAGIDLEGLLADPTALNTIANNLTALYATIEPLLDGDGPVGLSDLQGLLDANAAIMSTIDAFGNLSLAPDAALQASQMPKMILDYLLLGYLKSSQRDLHAFLLLFGIATEGDAESGTPGELHFERIGLLLSDPASVLSATYGWGTAGFDPGKLMDHLQPVLSILSILSYRNVPSPEAGMVMGYDPENELPPPQLRIPVLFGEESGATYEAGLSVLPLKPDQSADDAGLAVIPYAAGGYALTLDLGSGWRLFFQASLDANVPFGFQLRPNPTTLVLAQLGNNAPPPEIHAAFSLLRQSGDAPPLTLFGDSDSGRLEIISVGVQAGFEYAGQGSVFVDFPLRGRLVIKAPSSDGFLGKFLPAEGLEAPFDVAVGWSSQKGLYFSASSQLEITVPINQSVLGFIDLQSAYFALGVENDKILLTAALTARLKIGPFAASVERIGATATLSFPAGGGNAGPLQLDVAFRPPSGAALVLDSSLVTGGGYLFHDPEKGEYAGMLALGFRNVALTATGILNTRKPDGTPGFSLLLILSGEFPPIQLGFGFWLRGVGGLIGINRTADVEALQAGVRAGSLDSVMFPQDPLENAPQIIADLASFFPQAEGRYLFGPMASLSWGAPTIITAEVGLILELPPPIRLIILGQLGMFLPDASAPLVAIQADVLGVLDFEQGTLSIDASLRDSRILAFTLTGDIALRLKWLGQPSFAFSAGGFNPRAQPPPDFPSLNRMALALGDGDNPRLRLEAYLALTSNTAQIGAHLDAYAKAGIFEVEGYFTFDALFQFVPFRFIVDMSAGVSVRAGDRNILTLTLELMLAGPNPWNAAGEASFKVAGVRVRVRFNVEVGQHQDLPPAEKVDLLGKVEEALANERAWTGGLPTDESLLVSLREVEETGTLLVHPLGALSVRQRVVPLGVEIDTFGNMAPEADTRVELSEVLVGSTPLQVTPIEDDFAPAQFFNMTDDQKLARPAFEKYQAGATLTAGEVRAGERVHTPVEYETVIHDPALAERKRETSRFRLSGERLGRHLRRGAVARGKLSRDGAARFQARKRTVGVKDVRYTVASSADLTDPGVGFPAAGSYSSLAARLDRYLVDHPEAAATVHMIPTYEMVD